MHSLKLSPLEAPFDPAIQNLLAQVTPSGKTPLKLFRTIAHNPRVLQRLFAGSLLDAGSLSLRQRELLILRTCARCESEYEWGVHAALFAVPAGLSRSELQATLEQEPSLAGAECALLRLVDALHDSARVPDALAQELAPHFRPEQIVEAIALVGFYHTISFFTNALGVENEAFAPRFPTLTQGVATGTGYPN